MQIALVITVLNEFDTISALWQSIMAQTRQPDEVVIVDGGSSDGTVARLRDLAAENPDLKVQILTRPGNRSVGRNWAIQHVGSQTEWLACTDAGCVLEPAWLAELVKTQQETGAAVVAGYYRGQAETSWQAAVVPYVLVMPDKLRAFQAGTAKFLPATRSLLMAKSAWRAAGQFDERLADNEDYALAHAFVKLGVKLAFCPTAIVAWQPPRTWGATFRMFYRFARGDAASGLWRPKVSLVFARYVVGGIGLALAARLGVGWLGGVLGAGGLGYLGWAVAKNRQYVPAGWSWVWLVVLQITADVAVMSGSVAGLGQRWKVLSS